MYPPPVDPSSSGQYEDRKTGLVLFGIMTVLIGTVCALFVPLMLAGQSMAPKTGASQDIRMLIPGMVMYGTLAVVFIWLGIGSMKARRWARALLLVLSWCWLIVGLVTTAVMGIALPKITAIGQASAPAGQPAPPAAMMGAVMGVMMIVVIVIFVIIPGVWVFFYQSRNVKATCEAEDPVVRWTDRCPLPVIAVCLWLAFSVPWMVFMPLAYHGVFPLFGSFLVGPAASAIYILVAILWGYSARAMYQLRPSGWWIVTVTMCLFSVSSFLTYPRHDISELYTLMGYPAEVIAQIQKYNFMSGKMIGWMTLAGAVPLLGYMLFLRRYFAQAEKGQ